ncbi:uncharacterized protein [Eurosta solidaginis]|uniref:uncharacterized protein n=1 Tax=Eurosta solidaginis TaxID=178769 RepID=UPI0035316AFB
MLSHKFVIAPLSILIFLTSSCLVAGQMRRPGWCRADRDYVSIVNPSTFRGSWYVHSRYPFWYDENYRCCKIDYTPGIKNVHRVRNFQISNKDESVKVNTGTLTSLPDGEIEVKYDEPGALTFNYNILTYCTEYVIIYACKNLDTVEHDEYLWIHTKDPKPPKHVIHAYEAALEDEKISTSDLKLVRHEDCGKYETNQKSVAQQQSNSKGKSVCF